MSTWAVLGDGTWGRALAGRLAAGGATVRLVGLGLPAGPLPAGVEGGADVRAALAETERVLVAVPISALDGLLRQAAPAFEGHHRVVTTARGLTAGELPRRATELVLSATCVRQTGVLAGAADAEAVESGHPVAVVVGSAFPGWAREIQAALSGARMRVYTNNDPVGVELANALAPLLAVALGAARALGVGAASEATALTRAMAEMDRLVQRLGGRAGTAHGLAGLGVLVDLALEARSSAFDAGRALSSGDRAAGDRWPELRDNARGLALRANLAGIRAPMLETVAAMFEGRVDAAEALSTLMSRAARAED